MSHPVLSEIVGRGMQRSPTFRQLVSRLQASDVVVQVRLGTDLAPDAGVTEFVSAGKDVRFVRITVNVAEASDAAVALLAHELRHAVEIADAQTVSDAATYAGLFRAIGFASCEGPVTCYDTEAAIEAGRRVMRELRS